MIDFRQVSIFSSLNEEELALVERHARPLSYKKNTVIFTEGDSTESMYVIESGRAKVSLTDEEGREIIINDLEAGDYFGELSILDNQSRSASVETVEDCKLYAIHRDAVGELLQNPETAQSIIKDLVQRIRELSVTVRNMALMDVYNRIADLLISLAEDKDGQMITKVQLTQEDIAKRIGAARESVTRILTTLKSGGFISYSNKHIVIEKKLPRKY